MTFTPDEKAVNHLNETARRLSKPKSEIVRDAIEEAYKKSDRLSDEEADQNAGFPEGVREAEASDAPLWRCRTAD